MNTQAHELPELFPCPLCGASNALDQWPSDFLDATGANVVRCAWCHGAAPLKTWNRRTALKASTVQAVGDWVMVPREPTEEMLEAAMQREDDEPTSSWGRPVQASHESIYAAMLAAAPQPPAASVEDVEAQAVKCPWDNGSPCLLPRPVGMVYPPLPEPRAFGYLDKSGVEWAAYDTGQMEAVARVTYSDGWEAGYVAALRTRSGGVEQWTDEQCIEFASVAFRHAPRNLPKGVTLNDIRIAAARVLRDAARTAPAMTVIDPDQWEPCSPAYLSGGGSCDAPRVWNAETGNHWHPKRTAPVEGDARALAEQDRDLLGTGYLYAGSRLDPAQLEVLAATTAPVVGDGWIVANANGDRFRMWNNYGPGWTDDRMKAVRFARREDAEAVFAEDEDAWRIVQLIDTARTVSRGDEHG